MHSCICSPHMRYVNLFILLDGLLLSAGLFVYGLLQLYCTLLQTTSYRFKLFHNHFAPVTVHF